MQIALVVIGSVIPDYLTAHFSQDQLIINYQIINE
jgi:hypothetical protein